VTIAGMSLVLQLLFWLAVLLLLWTQVGYGGALALVERTLPDAPPDAPPLADDRLPRVSLIVAAYAEADVIAGKVANALALDYPRDRLEIVVACDGSPDATAWLARDAGADRVLELPRGGKIRAQDQAVESATGDIVAFSDANALWEADALRRLVAPFADPGVGYVCGQVRFVNDEDGTNQEGVYWRYEMWMRGMESRLSSVTGGNGAIYATRRSSYVVVDDVMGHDLSFPFTMVKNGWRAVYAPAAQATEKMVPSIEGEFRRKTRMMSHAWPIVVHGGMLSPRGYSFRYAAMIFSHRALRYASPFLHVLALLLNVALVAADAGWVYWVTLAAQVLLLLAALLAGVLPNRALLIARYYVATTASIATGFWSWWRHGTPAGWSPPEGTR
jgi:cellulose synthase/poly-beta-1,6-N-acetylglucosamine synthase-like glycosyltransferase